MRNGRRGRERAVVAAGRLGPLRRGGGAGVRGRLPCGRGAGARAGPLRARPAAGAAPPRTVVETCSRRPRRDFVAVSQHDLAAHALAVDVRAVQASEVAQHEAPVALLEDAVLLRNDLVEELDRIVRMPPQAVRAAGNRSPAVLRRWRGSALPCRADMLARGASADRPSATNARI